MGKILHRYNATPGAVPASSSMSSRELAINTADGKVFTRKDDGTVVEVGASSGGGGMATVATLADLKARSVSGVANGTPILVSGFYAAGDGGGGIFNYNSSSSATANDGIIVAPNAGSGRWIRNYSGAVDVKWFGAKGDGATDDYAAINAAITYCRSLYKRVLPSNNGGTYPSVVATLKFPAGIFKCSGTLLVGGNYDHVNIEGESLATIHYTGTGKAVDFHPTDPMLPLMVAPITVRNITIRRDSVLASGSAGITTGTIGLYVERVANFLVEGVTVYGFDIGMQFDGAETGLIDFKKRGAIEHCNYGIRIQQKTSNGLIIKPNLMTLRDGYFILCYQRSLQIIRNAGESMTNNGSGGVISVRDFNFQGSSVRAVDCEYTGEVPTKGMVTFDSCWFEGAGSTLVSLTQSYVKLRDCFLLNGTTPIVLQDTASKIILEDCHAHFTSTPTGNALIRRNDGTTNDLMYQIQAQNMRISVDGVPFVPLSSLGAGYTNILNVSDGRNDASGEPSIIQSGYFRTRGGITGSIALGGGFENITTLDSGGVWLFSATMNDGGNVWRGAWIVHSNGGSVVITTLASNLVSLSASGATIRLVNNSGSDAIQLKWSAMRLT